MIDFKDVSLFLGGRDVLSGVSFTINRNERIGVVGPNGSGKTTLLSLIVGDVTPDKGSINISDKVRIGFLRQQIAFPDDSVTLTSYVEGASGELPAIREKIDALEKKLSAGSQEQYLLDELGRLQSIYEHLGGYDMPHLAAEALAGLGFRNEDLQKPIGDFSGGWQMRACMARVLLGEPDVLLLDEPSNYLDIPAVEWLQRRLKSYTGTLLLVSHDRFLLNSLTTTTLEINLGKATRYQGNYSYYASEREARKLHADAERRNIQKKKDALTENINRFRAKATKAAQVQSMIKMRDKLEEVEIPEELHYNGGIAIPEPPHCGTEVIRLENVSHSYDGKRFVLSGVSFSVANGDKIGIVGYNGMGKSTLLKIIAGRMEPTSGRRVLGHNVICGYQAQDFSELLPPEQSAFDVVKEASLGLVPGQRVREILGAFGFSGDNALKQCRVLSGGEKIRLSFARIFVRPPNLLILDEPTTHLDVSARETLQNAIKSYGGTVCIVSHDIEFIRGAADMIIELSPSGFRRFNGNFDYYREKILQEEAAVSKTASVETSEKAPSSDKKIQRQDRAKKRAALLPEKRRLEREVAKLEKALEDAEKEKSSIMEELNSAAADGKTVDYGGMNKRIKDIDYTISVATLQWENTATELEKFMKEYDAISD